MKIKTESSKGVPGKVTVSAPPKKIGVMPLPKENLRGWKAGPKQNC